MAMTKEEKIARRKITTAKYRANHRKELSDYNKKRYKENKERILSVGKKYRQTNNHKIKKRQWRDKNRLQFWAQGVVGKAIARNKIKRMPCEVCGKENAEAHHDDYNKPLNIKWLCKFHHVELHYYK